MSQYAMGSLYDPQRRREASYISHESSSSLVGVVDQ